MNVFLVQKIHVPKLRTCYYDTAFDALVSVKPSTFFFVRARVRDNPTTCGRHTALATRVNLTCPHPFPLLLGITRLGLAPAQIYIFDVETF